jgi:hypothetical protein
MSRSTVKFYFKSESYKKSLAKAQEVLMNYLEIYDIEALGSKVDIELYHEQIPDSNEFTVSVHAKIKAGF